MIFSSIKWVRQGAYHLPSYLTYMDGEYVLRNALYGWETGISVVGTKISNFQFSYDTTLFVLIEEELANLLERIRAESFALGLEIKVSNPSNST